MVGLNLLRGFTLKGLKSLFPRLKEIKKINIDLDIIADSDYIDIEKNIFAYNVTWNHYIKNYIQIERVD